MKSKVSLNITRKGAKSFKEILKWTIFSALKVKVAPGKIRFLKVEIKSK